MVMAYATIMEFDVDLDTHVRIGDAAGPDPVKGLILHAAGSSPNGVYSLDVWETKEDSNRFFSERMAPALESLNIPGGPPLSVTAYELPFVIRG
jgi:hypothetical protein